MQLKDYQTDVLGLTRFLMLLQIFGGFPSRHYCLDFPL